MSKNGCSWFHRPKKKGSSLGPVLLYTGPVEILTRIKLLTHVMILTGPVLLCTGLNPFPKKKNANVFYSFLIDKLI